MAGHDDEENFFSDDGLDDLPPNALAELEHNAIQCTQAHPAMAQMKALPSSDYGNEFEFEDEDLDDSVVVDEARCGPGILPPLYRSNVEQAARRQQQHGTSSNHNLAERQRQNGTLPPLPYKSTYLPQSTQVPKHESSVVVTRNQPDFGLDERVEDLQHQIQELLKERDALKQNLNVKAGEIAIVRSKHEKTVREYERELNAVRKVNAEQVAKQQKALESARIAERNAAIERDFIKQDLAEESERVRRLNRAREAERKDIAGAATTPKTKKPTLPYRDGFDDDEIDFISPSKISPSKFLKRNPGSPAKPGKRKRKPIDSPAGALEVIHADEPSVEVSQQKGLILDESILESLRRQDDRLNFLGTVLDHRPNGNYLRSLEELGKHALPSCPKETLQSTVLGKISLLGVTNSATDLPIEFCELMISMWSNCMEENYLKPVYLFLDMLTYALELKSISIAPHIIDSLVPLVQRTGDLVAIPRFNNASTEQFRGDIDVSACLAILYLAALGCVSEQQHIIRFWKLMRWDFVLLILSQNQPTADFEMMLRILSTSVLRDGFGTITADDATRNLHVGYIIDRLTYPLFETPCLPMSMKRVDAAVVLKLRLQILQLLTGITRSPYAGMALASHPNAIGRIVSLMSDELDVLYDYKAGHDDRSRLISLATRLLYHLVTKYDLVIDMQKKLACIHAGSQKYLLCLARLNFSEDDLILESGIDPEVAGCALEMLELAVTPEEGDAIHSAFSST